MREYKFRAWNKVKQRMYYDTAGTFLTMAKQYDSMSEEYFFTQFTGLSDKKCKDVYDGDIVCIIDCGVALYQIQYLEDNFKWIVNRINAEKGDWLDENLEEFESECLEVIGNIYENPELLEVKNNE